MDDVIYKLFGSELKDYQDDIVEYFDKSKKQVLLLYLTVGCGKTITSLACASKLLSKHPKTQIIILSPKSVQDEFITNLNLLSTFKNFDDKTRKIISELKTVLRSNNSSNIHFIAYNANNSQAKFRKLINFNNNYIFIIDELHLFMRGVIKVNLEEGEKIRNVGNAKNIYDMICVIKNKKVIGLTGTPSAKFPFELVPFFNIALRDKFPMTVEDFNKRYINPVTNKFIRIQELKEKLKGLVVYKSLDNSEGAKILTSSPSTGIKSSKLEEVEVEFSEKGYKKYLDDYKSELDEKGFTNSKNIYGISFGMKSTFHAKTFQDSIYVGPKDKIVINKINCPKIIKMYDDTKNINGLCVFYFKFVDFGVKVMEEKLKLEGYTALNVNDVKQISELSDAKGVKHYIIFSGNESPEIRDKLKQVFNSPENKHGKIAKYLILSSCGAVGVTLKNVRYLGIGSVEFNYSMIIQILGRVNRLGSHSDLEPKERTLTQKIYLSVKNEKYYAKHKKQIDELCKRTTYLYEHEKALCIDRIIFQDSIYDDEINEKFRDILRDVSMI